MSPGCHSCSHLLFSWPRPACLLCAAASLVPAERPLLKPALAPGQHRIREEEGVPPLSPLHQGSGTGPDLFSLGEPGGSLSYHCHLLGLLLVSGTYQTFFLKPHSLSICCSPCLESSNPQTSDVFMADSSSFRS